MAPTIQAVIFDMDGLLIDSEPLWRQAEVVTFAEVGLRLSQQDCLKTTGLRVDEVVAYWFRRFPWGGSSRSEVAARLVGLVCQKISEQSELKAGVFETLAFVKSQGARVALASSSSYAIIDTVLERFDLREEFEVVYSAQEEPYGKPHPGVYLTTVQRLGLVPRVCVALEDSLNGVIAAKAARLACIAIPATEARPDPRFTLADAVLGSLLDVDVALWEKLSKTMVGDSIAT